MSRITLILIFSFAWLSQNLSQDSTKLNINNVSTVVWNNGLMDYKLGFEYPKGSKRYNLYASGIYWAGLFNNEIRIGGNEYRSTLIPGIISSENESKFQKSLNIYRVRPDYLTSKFYNEINEENNLESSIREKYRNDFTKWPVELGAPYNDKNKNNKYDVGIDIPGFPGADQTVWFVCNDKILDQDLASDSFPFFSKRTNVEVQVTSWAYSKIDLLKGVIFKKYKITNKNKDLTIKNMYLAVFTDPEIGDYTDDLVGCDSTLGLGFIYNGNDKDYAFGTNLGAFGTVLLKGVTISGSSKDSAFIDGKYFKNKKDLGATSFSPYFYHGDLVTPRSIHFYNSIQGINRFNGKPIINPKNSRVTKFPYHSDPQNNSGWLDILINYPVYDKQYYLNSGPFDLAPEESQEIIFAQIVTAGNSRLGNVGYLKYLSKHVINFYKNGMFENSNENEKNEELPTEFKLEQNYPNPFNPSTTIRFSVPVVDANVASTTHVTLKVYDILCREVATLVDELKQPGEYNVELNVETRHGASLPSGVYFYRLTANDFSETKKMILIK